MRSFAFGISQHEVFWCLRATRPKRRAREVVKDFSAKRCPQYLLGSVVVGIYALVTLPMLLRYPPIWPDEVLFLSPAESLIRGEHMGTPVLAGFIPGMERYTYWQPPGYFITLTPLFALFSPEHHLWAMRLLSWLLGAASLGIMWLILTSFTEELKITTLGLVMLATHPVFLRVANLGRMELPTLACMAGAVAVYLQFLQKGGILKLSFAGFLSGLACLYHPAGVIVLVALALHQLLRHGRVLFARREICIFFALATVPMLVWLVYILQSPHYFVRQFGGQLARKTSRAESLLTGATNVSWAARPLQSPDWLPGGHSLFGVYLAAAVVLLALLLVILAARHRAEASMLGLWVLGGFALNLFSLEDWYPIYFVAPAILTLSWGVTTTSFRWARLIGLATIVVGIGWNVAQLSYLFNGSYGSWSDYRVYSSAIAAKIPRGSSILLKAIPDPYFGLRSEKKGYRFYEFVPESVTVDEALAKKTLASIDYVVDSGCCNAAYIKQYLDSHGTLAGAVMSPTLAAPPVRIWKLRP